MSLPILLSLIAVSFCPQTIFAQTEKLGIVKYTAPKGWTRSAKENVIVFSEINQAAGRFCFITLYGATSSVGAPAVDFANEWNDRVVKPWGGDLNPKTTVELDHGWTAIAGGAPIDFQGNKAFAFLTVISGFGKTVSLLGILNHDSYLVPLRAFAEGMDIDKSSPAQALGNTGVTNPGTSAPMLDASGHLIIPLPTRQLTVADLVGQWGENAGINTRYVDRYSGTYAGFESLHFTNKMTITAQGAYYNDFFAIQNGRKIKEDTSGTVRVLGRVLVIKERNTKEFVIRGWLELPDMTILEVCGPWYDDQEIPSEIFTNPDQGANLNSKWVRKK